ncbi:uncharacterized protein TrAFT101_003541 [Trichoderma asperellum]|uniref:uncharacterized protein n=1 Tax=Trichoderma asperellum TaxID=101201 RepID=UPI0033264FB5|nr:hypothetical protein TrAFT101_003541 [Trichoderma asperellum]
MRQDRQRAVSISAYFNGLHSITVLPQTGRPERIVTCGETSAKVAPRRIAQASFGLSARRFPLRRLSAEARRCALASDRILWPAEGSDVGTDASERAACSVA